MKFIRRPWRVVTALAIVCLIAASGCSTERGATTAPGLRSANDAAAPVALPEGKGHAGPILYSANNFGATLDRIDVSAGTSTSIGPFEAPNVLAVALSPDGALYTVTQGYGPPNDNPQLARVDRATGHVTPFGVNLAPEQFMGIGFAGGRLYGVNAGTGWLYRFNLQTGEATKVGDTAGCGDIMDLAWYHGDMYGAAWDKLYHINLQTGQAQLVTTLSGLGSNSVMGLAIDDDGTFYVSEILSNVLFRVDPVTGATTAVEGVTLNYAHGLEFVPKE